MSKASNYYGGYFWVAIVSFIVPLFVGYKAFENLKPTTKPTVQLDASGVDHAIWDYLLKRNVSSGLVDYDAMKKDYLFHEYIRQLGQCDPSCLETKEEKLALACNAYNAFVINGVISHKITDNVNLFSHEGKGFFSLDEHIYAGQTLSLDYLENDVIRTEFREPRIHVGLVCGARGCPPLRAEAFVGSRVYEQLQDLSVQFVRNPKQVWADATGDNLKLSKILAWYGANEIKHDWDERYPKGGPRGGHLAWINELTENEAVKVATQKAINGQANVEYFNYDWTLNSQADPGAPKANKKKSGGFGSGSIPDE